MNLKELIFESLTETPQSRSDLCQRFGISDRRLRRLISELRAEGKPICSNSYTSGYWIGQGKELSSSIRSLRSRGLALLEQANRMQIQQQIDGQRTLDV